MTLLFRCDSSAAIGTGHVMRDLQLAKRYSGARIVFAVRELEGSINHVIKQAGYELHRLESGDLDEFVKTVKRYDPDLVVIDHYGIDAAFEWALQEQTGAKLLCFDDTYEKHSCDIVLNHNLYARKENYEGLVPRGCELRCGRHYTLLRDEFYAYKDTPAPANEVPKVFIAMGGADSGGVSLEILRVLEGFVCEAVVVTTRANPHLHKLRKYVRHNASVTLHVETAQMAKLMASCDLAVAAAGSTMNELLFLRIPVIAVEAADNQRYMAEYVRLLGMDVLRGFDKKRLRNALAKRIKRR